MLAFSIQTNAEKLFSCEKTQCSTQIECLNGIRVISAILIVMGHTGYTYEYLPLQNRVTLLEVNSTQLFSFMKLFLYIYSFFGYFLQFLDGNTSIILFVALMVVETFFLISGLLTSINLLTLLEK